MSIQPLSTAFRSTLIATTTLAMGLALPLTSQAQNDLTIHVDGLSNDTVYLANYYGAKLFYNDTAVTDSKGKVVFKGKPFEEGGKYAVVIPGPSSLNSSWWMSPWNSKQPPPIPRATLR